VDNIQHLPVGVRHPVTVSAAIIVGEVEKLLGVCEQVVGIRRVDILEHDGSCSEGGGCLSGQIRTLRLKDTIFSAVKNNPLLMFYNTLVNAVPWNKDGGIKSLEKQVL
jgi:hypothetical protein